MEKKITKKEMFAQIIEQFEKLGALMKKYPQFEDLFKGGDAAAIVKAMKDIKGF